MNKIMYKITYGNKYVYNTELTSTHFSNKDLTTVALDFLESLPDYEIEDFLVNGELPGDWHESVFGKCVESEESEGEY